MSVLVPNLRGAQAGMASGAHQLNFPLSVSEQHSQANLRKSVSEAIEDFANVLAYRRDNPQFANVRVGVGLATAFGCTIAGKVPLDDVISAAEKVVALGPDEIAVADTVEAFIETALVDGPEFGWTSRMNFDRTRQEITERVETRRCSRPGALTAISDPRSRATRPW